MNSRPTQTTSQELRDELLQFIRQKFYEADYVAFVKDTRLLLKWVVLYPASWLRAKEVTLPADRYKEIIIKILMQAVQLGNTGNIHYRPAWLKTVLQSHFRIHGDEYYEEAKSIRTLTDHALLFAGKAALRVPDPVGELAAASRLLTPPKRQPLKGKKAAINMELKLSL
jgi:hypothetical protein